ncbi:MAG: redoxin domain-containing protein [Candidatus Cyclobacteriaceae bacterium M3_2C_046]
MRIHLVLWTFLVFFWGCTSSDQENTANEKLNHKAAFVADPQAVEEILVKTLPIGAKAPDFNLPGIDGKYYQLADFKQAKVLTIIFSCNHCPTAQAYEDRMIEYARDYKDNGVQVVAISPNSPLALLYDECGYSDLGDSYEEMIIRAHDKNYNFPYLYDGDTHQASVQYGPVATPHAFVFDQERQLQYAGRIDASEKPGSAQAGDLRKATEAVLAGNPVEQPLTKTFGCSVKWAWKSDWKEKIYRDWESQPVVLKEIDQAGLGELLKNPSEKLRLINVWATWCGPCVIEYPEFVITHRMYKGRDFEFISVSADQPDQREKALSFLQDQHSAVANYIFNDDDKYALIEAIDPDWNGALPYTVLVEPGGKKVLALSGTVDFNNLRKTLVEHSMIGRYY